MSDKLNQFDNEVAVNEDSNDIQDLSNRSSNRSLEGIYSYNTGYDYGSSTYFFPLCILGGFDIEFAADGSLDFAISNGEALIAHDETTETDGNIWTTGQFADQYKRNNVQQARHSTAESGVYPYSVTSNIETSKDRIDIIEIRFDRVETSENRYKLVTVGNRRVQQETSVDKYVEYIMSDVRIRRGEPLAPPASTSYDYGPRMPALDPDASVPAQLEWLPIAAVYIPASTTGFSSQPTITDLRLFYQPKMANGLVNGPVQSPRITTYGYGPSGGPWDQRISITKNSIYDDGFCFPIIGNSKNSEDDNPSTGWIPLSINTENHSYSVCDSAWPLVEDTMYYMYAFRASARIGTTGICVSATSPVGSNTSSNGKSGNPLSAITPPTPWPNRYGYTDPNISSSGTLGAYVQSHAHYLTSFKCYEDGATSILQPRPFKRQGNYTILTGRGYILDTHTLLSDGTSDDNIIFSGVISGASGTTQDFQVQALTNPPYDGSTPAGSTLVIPVHASAMRVELGLTWDSGTGSGYASIFSEEGENLPAGNGNVFLISRGFITEDVPTTKYHVFDIPLQSGYNTLFWLVVSLAAGSNIQVTIRVLGYYEQF